MCQTPRSGLAMRVPGLDWFGEQMGHYYEQQRTKETKGFSSSFPLFPSVQGSSFFSFCARCSAISQNHSFLRKLIHHEEQVFGECWVAGGCAVPLRESFPDQKVKKGKRNP